MALIFVETNSGRFAQGESASDLVLKDAADTKAANELLRA
jgi:hypothetical protein